MLGQEDPLIMPAASDEVTVTRRKPRTVDIASIESLDRDDCIERWWQMFGVAPPKYTSLEFMRKALAYETQVKAFGCHSNTVQRVLKASLKAVRNAVETGNFDDVNVDAYATATTTSHAEPKGVAGGPAPIAHQTIRNDNNRSDPCYQTGITDGRTITRDANTRSIGNTTSPISNSTRSNKSAKSTKPSVLSIRAGTHLVREWNGRTYQVEALDKGFRLDGKIYRSLSAIAKKITGAHWSGPRFFGLES